MRSRLKLGSPSGVSMLIFGRALSRQRSVPRMWQARMRIEKRTGWWHASERPKPSSTKRANDSRLLRGSSSGRRLQRGRVCALLEDRGALAVVLADHDDRAADDAGGGDVRERVGGDVGADHRLPG